MDVVLATKGSIDEQAHDASQADRHQMRMFSFKQLFNLFTTINNKSQVHDRLCDVEENIKDIYSRLEQQNKQREDLDQSTKDRFEKTKLQMDDGKAEQEAKN